MAAAGRLKREALIERYRELGARAFEMPDAQPFKAFVAARGEALRLFALFEALSESMVAEGSTDGWHGWPEALQNPANPEVEAFARAHDEQIRFHMWLQWIADMQLAEAHRRARDAGMRIGLYLDIAVGVAPDGAETWMDRASVVSGVRIGSPPDPFNEARPGLGSCAAVIRSPYASAIAPDLSLSSRRPMQHAGAVRIDHVMGLMRLYWIPEGANADDGAYVHYPLTDLMAHLAAASHRLHAVVIGEDLGTVPPGFRDILRSAEIQGCRVLYFERDGNAFRPAESYPREALACVSTHDLPTLRGWWAGLDIEARVRAGISSSDSAHGWLRARAEERRTLVARLSESGLIHGDIPEAREETVSASDQAPDEVCVAVHRFLARSPSRLVAVQLEDLIGMSEQANLPGTIDEHPNWRRKLACGLDDLAGQQLFQQIAAAMAEERPRRHEHPRATYRLQFRGGMTFDRAAGLAPYLARLGVSHLYASPIFAAVPGSTHGYDAIDMNLVDPELGGEDGFRAMAQALRSHDIGLILDFVPNHMGANPLNAWWRDVLEWGAAADHAQHFDIDWAAPKLIVPALPVPYGVALERGDFGLAVEPEQGALSFTSNGLSSR